MTDPLRTNAPAAHAGHDLSIVAALAARAADLDDAETAIARAQVASCTACADALGDFVALQTALPVTATPRRPRDFRLSSADAQRLHRSGWRRFLSYFGSPRDGFSRPLAIGLTTLGLAGVLLASIPSATLIGGSGGAAPVNEAAPIEQAAPAPGAGGAAQAASASAAAPAASAFAPVPAATGSATDRTSLEAAGLASAAPSAAASASTDNQVFTGGNPDEVAPDITGGVDTALRDDASGFSVLFVVAGALLIAGLGLFALRWSARRLS
jgi:hypothetical protein